MTLCIRMVAQRVRSERKIAKIEAAATMAPHKFQIMGGRLESVLEDRKHAAHRALIWHNLFYGRKLRRSVRMPTPTYGENAPLALHPEILDDVLQLVRLPKEVARAYRIKLAEVRTDSK